MLENLILLAVYVIEAVKYCLGVYIVFHEKVERKWLYGVGGMVMVLYLFGIQPMKEKDSLVIYMTIIIVTYSVIDGNIKRKAIQTFLLAVLLVSIDATVSVFTRHISENVWNQNHSQIFLDCLWGLIVLALLYFVDRKQKGKKCLPRKEIIFSIILFCGMLLIFTVEDLNFSSRYVDNIRFRLFSDVLVSLTYIGVCMLCWLLIYLRKQNEETVRMLQMEKILNEKQINYYRNLLLKEEETRRFRHDIKNHLICLNLLANHKKFTELVKYLEKMNAEIGKTETIKYQTGNELLNIILNEKLSKLEEVDITVQGMVGEAIMVEEIDLCVIIANLLDNAVEAVSHVTDRKKKIIVKIQMGRKWMEFTVVNSIEKAVVFDKTGLPVSTKMDKQMHGLGLKNVRRAVEKYGGELQCSNEKYLFVAKIFLPYGGCSHNNHLRS